MNVRNRVYEIVQAGRQGDTASRVFDTALLTLIVLNLIAIIVETIPPVGAYYAAAFHVFEVCSVVAFTVEYLLRIWSCASNPQYSRPVIGRLRFALTPMSMVDLLAVLPFYLPFVTLDFRFIRIVRVFRFFRVAKLVRYSTSLRTLHKVLRARKEELAVSLSIGVVVLILASSLMYYVENRVQPDAFSSIPAAMWWGATTLTTVGYGDVYPVTPLGKALGAVVSILGIGMFALPTAILGGGFVEKIQKKRTKTRICPHCGKELP